MIAPSVQDLKEVDEFLAELKTLGDPIPLWTPSTRPGELDATWPVIDRAGLGRATLRFRCLSVDRTRPSVSVIFRDRPIWRVDIVDPRDCKPNPLAAAHLGLPATVCGSHSHGWSDNREIVARSGFGRLPVRRPLGARMRRLPQALRWLAQAANLRLTPEQADFDVPPQSALFE